MRINEIIKILQFVFIRVVRALCFYLLFGTLYCSKYILYKELVKYQLFFIMFCYALLLRKIDVIIDNIFN